MIPEIGVKTIFAILASLVGAAGVFPYLRDIFLRKTKPHAYSFLVWTITQGTAVAGLWYGNGGWGAIAFSLSIVPVFFTFLFSLKYGTRNITKGDTIILVAALLAIIVWWRLHEPVLSVLMVSIIDVAGYFPTFRKTFKDPWSETVSSWTIFSLSNILSMMALNAYNFLTLAYLVSITIANLVLLAISLARRRVVPRIAN